MINTNNRENISDEILEDCIQETVLGIEGVYGFAGGISNSLSKNFLGKELAYKGIRINRNDNDNITADLDIYVDYGAKIPTVAWDVQVGVRKEILKKTGIRIGDVNINVKGVRKH